jgi:hypothetical protein
MAIRLVWPAIAVMAPAIPAKISATAAMTVERRLQARPIVPMAMTRTATAAQTVTILTVTAMLHAPIVCPRVQGVATIANAVVVIVQELSANSI